MAVLILNPIHYGINNWIVRYYSNWSTLFVLKSLLDSCVFGMFSSSIQCYFNVDVVIIRVRIELIVVFFRVSIIKHSGEFVMKVFVAIGKVLP